MFMVFCIKSADPSGLRVDPFFRFPFLLILRTPKGEVDLLLYPPPCAQVGEYILQSGSPGGDLFTGPISDPLLGGL